MLIHASYCYFSLKFDKTDREILRLLQQDAAMPLEALARAVFLTPTPAWRRIQKLESAGVIRRRVALCDADKLGVGVTVFVSIKTAQHNAAWLEKFASAVRDIEEVVELYRMSGDVDYLMHLLELCLAERRQQVAHAIRNLPVRRHAQPDPQKLLRTERADH